MFLIFVIDFVVVGGLCAIAFSRGLERALPFAAFMMVFLPIECRIPLWAFELTTHRLIIVVLGVLYFALERGGTRGVPNRTLPLKWIICAHVTWCLISTAASIVPMMSVKKLLSIVFEYYLLYFVFWKTVSHVKTIHRILFAMVLAIIVCSVFGAFEAYGGLQVISLLPSVEHRFSSLLGDADRVVRVQSTFDHAILFGAALAMAIMLDLYLLDGARKSWQKVLLWSGLLLMFLNIYKTSSRGPWLDVIFGFVILVFLGGKGVRKRILLMGALSIVVMVIRPGIWHTIEGIYENTMNDNTDTGTSYEYRYALPRVAVKTVLRTPGRALWGFGLESFFEAGVEGDFLGKPHKFLSADDSWVELMVETGFVGLSIIAVLLWKPVFLAWKDFRRIRGPGKYLCSILLVNIAIFYFQMYSVGMYSWGQNGYMLWILIALTLAYGKCRMAESISNRKAQTPTSSDVAAERVLQVS
jgi:hypothetical protein